MVCITLSQVLLITNLLVSRQAGMFLANYSQSQQSASKQSKPKEVSGAAGSSNSQQPAGTTHQPIRGYTFFPGNQWLCHIQHGGQLSSNVMSCQKPVCHRVVNILQGYLGTQIQLQCNARTTNRSLCGCSFKQH